VNTFTLRLDPRRDDRSGKFAPAARFSITLESGTSESSINIMQRRRGVRITARGTELQHGPPAPRSSILFGQGGGGRPATVLDLEREPLPGEAFWITDHVPGQLHLNYTWNGTGWRGVTHTNWVNVGRGRRRVEWTDTPGWSSIPEDSEFPVYLGGPNRDGGPQDRGFFDFVTYIVCKETRSAVCAIRWGIKLQYRRVEARSHCDGPSYEGYTRVHIWGQETPPGVIVGRSREAGVVRRSLLPEDGSFEWDFGP
jgi:hypothetical protein